MKWTAGSVRVEYRVGGWFQFATFAAPFNTAAIANTVLESKRASTDKINVLFFVSDDLHKGVELTFCDQSDDVERCACVFEDIALESLRGFFVQFHANPVIRKDPKVAAQVFHPGGTGFPGALNVLRPVPVK